MRTRLSHGSKGGGPQHSGWLGLIAMRAYSESSWPVGGPVSGRQSEQPRSRRKMHPQLQHKHHVCRLICTAPLEHCFSLPSAHSRAFQIGQQWFGIHDQMPAILDCALSLCPMHSKSSLACSTKSCPCQELSVKQYRYGQPPYKFPPRTGPGRFITPRTASHGIPDRSAHATPSLGDSMSGVFS